MKKFLVACFCGTFAAVAFGKTIYVSPEGAGNKDGTSPENAYAARECIGKNKTVVSNDDTVKLLEGTYHETGTEWYAIQGRMGVIIEGDTANPSSVILDGGNANVRFFGVEIKNNVRAEGTIRGMTFRNTNSGDNYQAVYINNSTVRIEDCVFSNVTNTGGNGAAVWCSNSNSTGEVYRCSFTDCASSGSGGAIARKDGASNIYRVYDCGFTNCCAQNAGALQGPGIVDGCTFSNCQKVGTSYSGGGAIWSDRTDYEIEIRDSTFVDCSSYKPGGALNLPSVANVARVTGCTFENCSSTGDSGGAAYGGVAYTNCVFKNCVTAAKYGGAIHLSGASKLAGCKFLSCSATTSLGGAIYLDNSAELTGCLFTNCVSASNGGAIYAAGGCSLMTVSNSTFIGCSAKTGGAIDCAQNSKTYNIFNCKFLANMATEYPASINANCGNNSSVSLFVRNCLFAGNSVPDTSGNGAIDIRGKMTDGSSIDNCTFVGGRGTGAPADKNLYPIVLCDKYLAVKNCVFWDNQDTKGRLVSVRKSGGNKIPVVNSASDAEFKTDSCVPENCITLTASPFKDAANGDYTLPKKVGGADNPCLEAGVKLDWMTKDSKDLAGHPRLRGDDIVDLGCYEYFQKSGLYLILR